MTFSLKQAGRRFGRFLQLTFKLLGRGRIELNDISVLSVLG